MTQKFSQPRKWFFPKTRELGEREWEHGLKTPPLKRLFRIRKRMAILNQIRAAGEKAHAYRIKLDGFARYAHWPITSMMEPIDSSGTTIPERAFDLIGQGAHGRAPYSSSRQLLHMSAHHTGIPLGNVAMMYRPTMRLLTIDVRLDPVEASGVRLDLGYEKEFPPSAWKRKRDPDSGSWIYTWEEVIPRKVAEDAFEWRSAHIGKQIMLDRYKKAYTPTPNKKTDDSKPE